MSDKKKGALDKLVMGAIIGTAIGSVIGMAVAPKKGEETRQYLKDQYRRRDEIKEIKEIKKLTKETFRGLGTLAKNFFFNKKNDAAPLKKIPRETELENTFDHLQD